MNDEEILKALAGAADERRRRRKVVSPYAALAEGRLSPAEAEALEEDSAPDPERHRMYEMARPFDGDERRRLLDAVGRTLTPSVVSGARLRAIQRPSLGARLRVRRRLGAVAAPLAIAAALFLWMRHPPSAALPAYELTFVGGERLLRSASEPPPKERRIGQGDRFELILRPVTPVERPLAVRVFLSHAPHGDELREFRPSVEVSAEGAVRISGTGDTLPPIGAGACEIAVAVGQPAAMPKDATQLLQGGDGWRVLRTDVELLARPLPFH